MERFVSFPFLMRQNNAGIASYSHIWLKKMRTDQNTVPITYFQITQFPSLKATHYNWRGKEGIWLQQANFTVMVTFHLLWCAGCEIRTNDAEPGCLAWWWAAVKSQLPQLTSEAPTKGQCLPKVEGQLHSQLLAKDTRTRKPLHSWRQHDDNCALLSCFNSWLLKGC